METRRSRRFHSLSHSPAIASALACATDFALHSQTQAHHSFGEHGLGNRFGGVSSDEGSNPSPSVFVPGRSMRRSCCREVAIKPLGQAHHPEPHLAAIRINNLPFGLSVADHFICAE